MLTVQLRAARMSPWQLAPVVLLLVLLHGTHRAMGSPFAPHPLPPSSSASPFFEGWFTRVVARCPPPAAADPAHYPGSTRAELRVVLRQTRRKSQVYVWSAYYHSYGV